MLPVSLKKVLVRILSTPMVLETGTDGIWTYRKWSDGTAECWGYLKVTNLTINNAWGNGFLGDKAASANFPTNLFTSAPIINANAGKIDNDSSWTMTILKSDTGPTTANNTGTWTFFRTSAQTTAVTASVAFYAIGKWATLDPSTQTMTISTISLDQMTKAEIQALIEASGNQFKNNDIWIPSNLT